MELTGRWALVTGASSGLGVDFARELAQRGMNLVLVARREARLRALADELRAQHGREVEVEVCDLGAEGGADTLVDRLAARGRRVSVLVNNAGFAQFGPRALLDGRATHVPGVMNTLTSLLAKFGPRRLVGRLAGSR